MRQLLEHFHRTLRNTSGSCDGENHGCEGTGHATGADVVAEASQRVLHRLVVLVHVGAADQERRLVLFLQQEFADASQEVEGACNASVATERNEALRELALDLGLTNALEVDHSDVKFAQLVKQTHVVILRLDRVREKEVGLVGEQCRDGHFFDAEDDRGFGHVLLDGGARIHKFVVAEAADGGGLDEDADAYCDNEAHLTRRERAPALPLVLALAEDSNCAY